MPAPLVAVLLIIRVLVTLKGPAFPTPIAGHTPRNHQTVEGDRGSVRLTNEKYLVLVTPTDYSPYHPRPRDP